MPTYFQRPENALKRANEFIDVGKKQRALDALYDVIKSKKHRTWQKIHEPIMEKYLELCVELKKSHIAKEGLYQYKNICQQVNIKSLEDVVRNYLKLAEEKTEAAREESQQAVVDIDDLDNLLTPESLLLSAVSGEDTQDRTDRVVLTPWVKFLWESYRQCLELLRNNSRVEALYHDIARQAFKFCLKYTRKTEFRKLCESLRTHLGHIHKHQNQQTAINLNNPESQAMHLETRLVQLDSAINMELWQEAYKAIEDIHLLMTLSKKPPKPQLMANYYQKLALVFWKAGNYLFHASALHRLFHLSRELKKNLTQDEVQRMASKVLLATLAIPIPPSRNEIDKYLELDDTTVEKQRRLATLLSLPTPPTRTTLIKDLVKYSVVQFVIPELQNIYHWLEVEFHPLQLCSQVSKCFEFISESKDSDIHQYMPALQDITIMRLLKQVSQVYQTIEFSRLATLAPFASLFRLERLIVDAARTCDLQVRIDHRTKTLSFGTDLGVGQREDVPEGPYLQSMPSEQIRNQLIQMSCALHKTVDLIQPAKRKVEQDDRRLQIISSYRTSAKKEHQRILTRRQIIEDRKEMLENLSVQREQEEQKLLEEQKRKVYEAEMLRLEREAEERERLRRQEEHEKIQKMQVQERIDQLIKSGLGPKIFKDLAEEELKSLNAEEIMAKQVEQLDREKKELTAKLKAQEKKIDYFARAMRLEELPPLQTQYEEQAVKDKEFWEQQEQERIKTAIQDRQQALEMRNRLRHMQVDKDKFFDQLTASRMSVYKDKLTAFEKILEEERQKRQLDRKIQRKLERRVTRKREKEEEEKRKKEEEMKKEIARKKAEEDAAYKAKMAKLEEIAAKQRAREREIEERAARQAEENRREKDKDSHERSGPWKPTGEGRGGWREREKDRERSWRTPVNDDLSASPPPGKSDREADRDDRDDDWRNRAPSSLNEDSDKKHDVKGPPPRRDDDKRLKDDIRRGLTDDIRHGASDDIRRPTDDIRRPTDDIRRPTDDIRRPTDDIRHPTDDIRRPTDDIRRPTDDIRRPTDDIRRPTDDIRRPTDDIRRPTDDIRRGPTDDIRRGPTDDIRRGPTDDIRRGPTDDIRRGPTDDIRRTPLDDIRRGPSDDIKRGSPDGIRRGLSDDIRRGTPDDIRRWLSSENKPHPPDEFRWGPTSHVLDDLLDEMQQWPAKEKVWRRDDRSAPQRDDRVWRRDDQRSTPRPNDDSEWRRDDRIQSSRDDRGLSSREDRVISSRDVMDKDRRTPLRRDDNWRTGDREQSSRTDTKKWRREDFSQDDKGRFDDRGPPSRDWSFKDRGMDDDNRVWRKDDRTQVRRNDDSDWRGGFKERVGALPREKEDRILPRDRDDKAPAKERERLLLKKVDHDDSSKEEKGGSVRKSEGRRIEAEDEDGWQTVRH